jgi:hypothetical protein
MDQLLRRANRKGGVTLAGQFRTRFTDLSRMQSSKRTLRAYVSCRSFSVLLGEGSWQVGHSVTYVACAAKTRYASRLRVWSSIQTTQVLGFSCQASAAGGSPPVEREPVDRGARAPTPRPQGRRR